MNAVRVVSVIIVAAGSAILAAAAVLSRGRLELTRTWKPVDVRVIRNWMETHVAGSAGEESTSYSAHYELEYTLNEKSFRSIVRTESAFIDGAEAVQMRLVRHGPGTHGVAYADPDDPTQLRLDLGKHVSVFALPLWLLLAGASFLLIGISLWFIGTPAIPW